ncbi:MAG TPA: hypothetical protein PKX23_13015 [Verrucomicrobiota bacterium]|nr:hypothetical protein [Verrucomicrobiota bacterium]
MRLLHDSADGVAAGILLAGALTLALPFSARAGEPPQLSGIYPSLAMFNNEGECGTGGVVPWAGRLWVVTYAPHAPQGSSDKLYEITPDLRQIIRPESIGGTPANRMIHRESRQLFLGPYVIDAQGGVRVIAYSQAFGRPTGNARHLSDPARRIYLATMEEGLYEIDVESLAVTELWADEQKREGRHSDLPGYHGKGLYSGQGVVVYANNGEHGREAQQRPEVPSGVLAEWDGTSPQWRIVRRNQFTEVTGPGGLYGNAHPETDPIWSIGWDHRSLILMVREAGVWHAYRLPKASHSYDGAHGWNTEWPRIRDIGERDLLMTMHGMFWRFPRNFRPASSAGLRPRSTYLKVIGDFCRWNDRLVFGCDDTARNEFLNKRKAKGEIAAPQSQSNLWFVEPDRLDDLGPVIGRGGVWVKDDVPARTPSEPFLVSGFERRGLHLAHEGAVAATVKIELDRQGNGRWQPVREVTLPPRGYRWIELTERAVWMRLSSDTPLTRATAWFQGAGRDSRSARADRRFDGLAGADERRLTGGLIRARGEDRRTLAVAALAAGPGGPVDTGYYELDGGLNLRRVEDPAAYDFARNRTRIPAGVLAVDSASVVFTDDAGRRWRLPKGDPAFDRDGPLGPSRVDREVATERDLFNAHGTFYELPAENAGGFAKVRPITTHNRRIHDYCSYRGLLILTGIRENPPDGNPHLIRSADGKALLWAGALDDLWKLGKPRGSGGPWNRTDVRAGVPSDPYLMTGYDQKSLTLSHEAAEPVTLRVEVDLTGDGQWVVYRTFEVLPGKEARHRFPDAYAAYWVRVIASRDCRATAWLEYR